MNNSKIVLITGGSRGLGKSAALTLAEKGMDVIITYHRRQIEAEAVVSQIEAMGRKAVALALDVSETKSFAEFKERLSETLLLKWNQTGFDYLVNNAGIGMNSALSEVTEDAFDSLMKVHLKGTLFLTQALMPLITDGGGIVNFSTGLTRFCLPGYGAYASMKGAVEVLSKYLAKELGPRRIRVNVVAPGAIDTDFNKEALAAHPELRGFIDAQTALGRMGEPEDIGHVVAALCTEELGWVNAQRLEASGGMFL